MEPRSPSPLAPDKRGFLGSERCPGAMLWTETLLPCPGLSRLVLGPFHENHSVPLLLGTNGKYTDFAPLLTSVLSRKLELRDCLHHGCLQMVRLLNAQHQDIVALTLTLHLHHPAPPRTSQSHQSSEKKPPKHRLFHLLSQLLF